MPLFNMSHLRAGLAPNQRLLGIDPGRRSIGLALSDVSLLLASPYGTLTRGKLARTADEIAAIVRKEAVGGLVAGLPLSLDGSFGPAAQAARDWMRSLSDLLEMPAALWDERMSSNAVNRMLINDLDMTRGRRAEVVDKIAAAYILQGALDASRSPAGETDGGRDRD